MNRAHRLGVYRLLATVTGCAGLARDPRWWDARHDSSGQAPDPATTAEAVIQVYAARTVGWKGALGVHTGIAVKPSGAADYTRYDVIGWGWIGARRPCG